MVLVWNSFSFPPGGVTAGPYAHFREVVQTRARFTSLQTTCGPEVAWLFGKCKSVRVLVFIYTLSL